MTVDIQTKVARVFGLHFWTSGDDDNELNSLQVHYLAQKLVLSSGSFCCPGRCQGLFFQPVLSYCPFASPSLVPKDRLVPKVKLNRPQLFGLHNAMDIPIKEFGAIWVKYGQEYHLER